MNHRQN